MDVIILSNLELETINSTGNTIENILRYRQIKSYYSGLNNVIEVMREYPKVNYRYLLMPS